MCSVPKDSRSRPTEGTQSPAAARVSEPMWCAIRVHSHEAPSRYMMITMRHILHAFLVGLGLAAGVQTVAAQPAPQPSQQAGSAFALPPESVTITATKPSDETIRSFVEARAQPTYVLGRMARWNKRICPVTMGLGEKYAKYVTQRIRDVPTAVGAPVDGDPSCRP